MAKKQTTESFIAKAKLIFPEYDYSKTVYKGITSRIKIIVTCNKHGDFEILPEKLLQGQSCQKCSREHQSQLISCKAEDFIKRSKEYHGDFYNYDKVNDLPDGLQSKVTIICPEHGEFITTARIHLNSKCKQCAIETKVYSKTKRTIKLSTEQYIELCKEKHNDFYSYNKTVYTGSSDAVIITCPVHGDFKIKAYSHLRGNRCILCVRDSFKSNTKDFITKSNIIHNNKYDYSNTNYIDTKTKVIIICPEHGEFLQTPSAHLNNQGCPTCGNKKRNKKSTKTIIDFITQANIKHDNFYSYDKTKYTNSKNKIIVTCPVHGDFITTPKYHLGTKSKAPMGCSECSGSISKGALCIRKYLKDNNIQYKAEEHLNCKNPNTNSYLYFDFWLPEYNTLIEFDGRQHYTAVEHWGGEEGLLETQYRDSIKTEYAKNNNIKLIRIHYKDINKIDKILTKELSIG